MDAELGSANRSGDPARGKRRWIRVASETELGGSLAVKAFGTEIALFRTEEGIFAVDCICSHEYSRLVEGEVWEGEVYCPLHGSRFSLRDGRASGLPATRPINTWDVKVEGGGIWIAERT